MIESKSKAQEFKPEIAEYPAFPAFYKQLLLILPLVFLTVWIYCFWQSKTFYSTYPDSIYIYLVNATNIAGGNLDIGHYDNPGTPVHVLGGFIVWFVHLFAGHRKVYEDVLADPEFYLRFCASAFALILLGSVYIAGRIILKHTGNLALSLLFQLIPVCSFFTIHYLLLIRMCPEDLIISVLISYYAFLWVLCYKRDYFPDSAFSRKSHTVLFAFVSALLVTTKMTCLPFLILPLFFLEKFSQKLWYCLLTAIFGALLIYPIWARLPEMYDWFTRLATHSGAYGQGEAGVSAGTLFSNLLKLFRHEYFFSAGYAIILVTLIAGIAKKKVSKSFYRLALAFFIICTAQLALASKQFGYHYLIASQMLIIPGIVGAYYLFAGNGRSLRVIYFLLGFCFLWFGFKTAQNISASYSGKNEIYQSAQNVKKYDAIPRIITTGYQGAAYVESGIRFGAAYGGPYYYATHYFLRQQYPNSYFYDMQLPQNIIKKWDIPLSPGAFFMDHPEVLIYFIRMSEKEEQEVIKKITAGLEAAITDVKIEYYNSATAERLYLIKTDTAKLHPHYVQKLVMKYDFDKLSPDQTSFAAAEGSFTLGEAAKASGEKAVSGKRSLKITSGEYSSCSSFEVSPGDVFEISAKYFSESRRPLGITLSDPSAEVLNYNSESITADYGNGWRSVSLKAVIPENTTASLVNFCLFYFGSGVCYADDLEITILKSNLQARQTASPEMQDVQKFILKSSGGNYVSLMPDKSLAANQPDASKAEVFEKVELGGGQIALKTSGGFFVSDDRSKKSLLIADRKAAQGWEMFMIIGNDLLGLNIRSSAGKFVCADHGDGDKLIANKDKASTWETFEVIKK